MDRMELLEQLVPVVTLEVLDQPESVVIRVKSVQLDWLDHRGLLACLEVLESAEMTVNLVKLEDRE